MSCARMREPAAGISTAADCIHVCHSWASRTGATGPGTLLQPVAGADDRVDRPNLLGTENRLERGHQRPRASFGDDGGERGLGQGGAEDVGGARAARLMAADAAAAIQALARRNRLR